MFRLFNQREAYNLQNCKIVKYIFALKNSCFNCVRHKSYYQILGLDSKASAKDIKSAYYELSLKYHPDKNKGSPESVEKFREITEAYEVLGNPQKRQNYDQGKSSSSDYSQSYTTKEGYYYKPYYSKQRYQGPYTGKTKDYDYDEHFRHHYEKQRMYEYEYIKRRWEAEFRRRYPDRDPQEQYYYRNQYKQTSHRQTREEFQRARREFYEEYRRLFAKKFNVFYFFIPFWCAFLIIPLAVDHLDPDKSKPHHGPIYYRVKSDKSNGQDNE